MSGRVFANLGFLLQISGLLTLLPIGVGLAVGETDPLIPLLLACVGFLACGFLLNALSERKDLDFKSSSVLFLAAFIILPLIGAIPYFYSDPFNSPNMFERFTNGYFESISGFTTTGFSFVQNSDVLSRSMLVYRSMTELMGGVGIVFLLLAFFHSKKSLNHLGNAMGVENVNGNLKRLFFAVLGIYAVYILVFTGVFYYFGFQDLIRTGTFMVDTITGGFQPSPQQYQQYLGLGTNISVIILMFLGSVNFTFNYHLFALKPRKMLTAEIAVFLGIIGASSVLVSFLAGLNPIDSLFHVVSMSSSTGYDYVGIPSQSSSVLSIFIVLMLIGGCAFSMAGGIRVSKLIAFGKSVKQTVKGILIREKAIKEPMQMEPNNHLEFLSASVGIILFIFTLVIFAVMFSTVGVSFTDALFEVGSALTTNGISMGATTLTMPLGYKWLLIVAMTIGRVEIMTVLIALSRFRTKSIGK